MNDADGLSTLIHELNVREQTTWAPTRKLAGGYHLGAYEVVAKDGARAVLKWWPPSDEPDDLAATAQAVADARRAGWPTPRWLSFGALPDGSSLAT